MKNKALSLILAVLFILTVAPVGIYAVDNYASPTLYVEDVYVYPGAIVDVDIKVANNPGISGATIQVSFDEGLELLSVKSGDAFDGLDFTEPGKFTSPCKFLWDSLDAVASADGTVLTLTFKVIDRTEGENTLDVNVSFNEKDIFVFDGSTPKYLNFSCENGKVNVKNYMPGDVNGDGTVNGKDVTLIRRFIVGGYDVEINEAASDVNNDQTTNSIDVSLIRRYITGGYDVELLYGTGGSSYVKSRFVVTNIPMIYTNLTQQSRRFDAYITGASYDSLFADTLYNTNGLIDKTGTVTLQNIASGYQLTMPASLFATLVKTAAGTSGDTTDAMNYVEQGSVVTITTESENKGLFAVNGDAYIENSDLICDFVINDSLSSDSYIGYATTTLANVKTGAQPLGWKYLDSSASASNTYTRLTSTPVAWANVMYDRNGKASSGSLVVNGEVYNVVEKYTGAENEIKVYAPSDIFDEYGNLITSKTVVNVAGLAGDTIYAGGVFSDGQKEILLKHGDYARFFSGNRVTTTFKITEDIPSFIAYEMEAEGGAFVTATSFATVSEFVKDGRLDQNFIDATNPLTVEEARQLILSPAQGECNVVFSDSNGDGRYDIAVVTESSRALYYGEINSSTDPANEGYIGGKASWTREIYDSFGNYIMSVQGLKGHGIGGLVVDRAVTFGGATGAGTDNWNLTSTNKTNKVQLVVCTSNERQIYAGTNDTNLYGSSALFPYRVVNIADLETAYIESVSSSTVNVGGTICYDATVKTASGNRKTIYIPVNPSDEITLDVMLDGILSPVKFNAGRSLLSFVTDEENGVSGSRMVGNTVKFVADENGVAWCMVNTKEKSVLTGYVTGISYNQNGYVFTVVTSDQKNNYTRSMAPTAEAIKYNIYQTGSLTVLNSFGIDALFAEKGEMKVKGYVVQQEAISQFGSLTASNVLRGVATYGSNLTGIYYDSDGDGVAETPNGMIKPTYAATGLVQNSPIDKAGIIISEYDYNKFVKPEYQNSTYFVETVFDAHDLFGAMSWETVGNLTESTTTKYIGASVKTIEVDLSADSTWQRDPESFKAVNKLLGGVRDLNRDADGGIVSGSDLIYLSFSKNAGIYYTIDGLDYASYNEEYYTGDTYWSHFYINYSGHNAIDPAHLSTNYRTRAAFIYRYPLLTTGAGHESMWTEGWNGDFDNQYLIDLKPSGNQYQNGNGYMMEYTGKIGYNPYYLRNINDEGRATYSLIFSTVEDVSGIYAIYGENGELLYDFSGMSTVTIGTDNDGNPIFKDPEYDQPVNRYVEDESALSTISVYPYVEEEEGYVPTLYHIDIKDGFYSVTSKNIIGSTRIVVITPDNTRGDFSISVWSVSELYRMGYGLFGTAYQCNDNGQTVTMLSVIGKIIPR